MPNHPEADDVPKAEPNALLDPSPAPEAGVSPVASADLRQAAGREAWLAAFGIVVVLGGLKHLSAAVPLVQTYAFAVATGVQLYLPILRVGHAGITRESLGLSLAHAQEDLSQCALFALLTFLPFAVVHHLWQTMLLGHTFHFRLPPELAGLVVELGVAALAEELFFRGYLQERLALRFPARHRFLGVPFGVALVTTSAVFALAHFAGEYRLDRLGPFFPGLLFGVLRARTQTIVGSTAYHLACNLVSETLWHSYR